jgi:hypothetical protein
MKDYMQLRGLNYDEWENDKEWLAHRMQFIWDYRNLFTADYLKNGMSKELQSGFYSVNDPEVSSLAAELDNYTDDEIEYYKSLSDEQIKKEYGRISSLSTENIMKRENRMLYIYIQENKHDVVF